jgi:hypothetical protein
MAIEFRCPSCQRLLRVSDEAAGVQAQCPECGAIAVVPPRESAPPGPGGSQPLPHGAGGPLGPSPFGIWALVVLNDPWVKSAFRS